MVYSYIMINLLGVAVPTSAAPHKEKKINRFLRMNLLSWSDAIDDN